MTGAKVTTPLPEPIGTALVQGPQGSEYRLLSDNYDPDSAMHSPNQLRQYGEAEYRRGIKDAAKHVDDITEDLPLETVANEIRQLGEIK